MKFFLISLFFGMLYILPSMIAGQREHPNTPAICALNILLGWTFVGWVVSLVWALTAINKPAPPAEVPPST